MKPGNEGKKTRNRQTTRIYTLHSLEDTEPVQVCQKFFLATHAISEQSIRTALKKKTDTGTIQPDLRGCHKSHITVADVNKERAVVEHIKLSKCVESYYVRKEVKWQYLPEELKEMHRMYVEYRAEMKTEPESYTFYHYIFTSYFIVISLSVATTINLGRK